MRFARTLKILFTTTMAFAATLSIAHADTPGFNNLTQDDFDKAIRELSANSSYHSVTGAGTLGDIFGFEVGLVAGVTRTPDINTLSKNVDANADISRLPHASLLLAASVPLGFTGELLLFPERTISGLTYSHTGASVKWTATNILMLPFNLAVRGFVTNNKVSFQQTLQNASTGNTPVQVTVNQDNKQTGLQLLASPNLPFFEPYAGVGIIKATGSLAVTGTGTIFAFTSSQSAESSPTSTQLLLGVNANLLLLNMGLEYARAFGTDSFNLKLGIRF